MRSLLTELDNDWNRSDAASLSKLFAEDSDLVDTSVHRFQGRANIEEHIADLLAHSMKGTDSRTTVLTDHSLGPDLAVLEIRWELKGGALGDTPLSIMGLRLISHPRRRLADSRGSGYDCARLAAAEPLAVVALVGMARLAGIPSTRHCRRCRLRGGGWSHAER